MSTLVLCTNWMLKHVYVNTQPSCFEAATALQSYIIAELK